MTSKAVHRFGCLLNLDAKYADSFLIQHQTFDWKNQTFDILLSK